MTKIAIQPNASGTGTFTLTAPDSNDNRTFTLPDATGEVLTDQSDIETQVKTAANASGSAPIYACRAWVNFDGTTTPPSIRASGNVSSVSRTATGRFTINFATAMPDSNYAAFTGTGSEDANINLSSPYVDIVTTTTQIGIRTTTFTGSSTNFIFNSVAIFR